MARRDRRAKATGSALGALLTLGLGIGRAAMAAGEGDTVVLLHGLGRSETNMKILEWRLAARGYHVCNLGYDSRIDRIERVADAVARSIETCRAPARRVHFVTHSLGGLVLRSLLARHEIADTGRAVMLAPPNGGSEIADRLGALGWLEPILGPLAPQLGTGEEDLPRRLPPPTIPFGVIAGDQWINPAGPLWLPRPHDGTVSVASTRLAGMSDHIVLPYTHTFIVAAGPVADQVHAFLRSGGFDHQVGPSGPNP